MYDLRVGQSRGEAVRACKGAVVRQLTLDKGPRGSFQASSRFRMPHIVAKWSARTALASSSSQDMENLAVERLRWADGARGRGAGRQGAGAAAGCKKTLHRGPEALS